MSPVAADFASADSAPAEAPCECLADPPQAATPSAATTRSSSESVLDTPAWCEPRPDSLLKGSVAEKPASRYSPCMQPKVLLAEDDASLRGVLSRGLEEEGFDVLAVATGRELLDYASREPPAALLVDIGLPDSDGRDVCQALRSQGVHTPVLFLTARDALTDRLAGFQA